MKGYGLGVFWYMTRIMVDRKRLLGLTFSTMQIRALIACLEFAAGGQNHGGAPLMLEFSSPREQKRLASEHESLTR